MKLIVESGATKTDWRFVEDDGKSTGGETAGMNFAVMPREGLRKLLAEVTSGVEGAELEELCWYGAGLIGENLKVLREVAGEVFPMAKVEGFSDVLACARAVWGHKEGIAAILGTGSNCCLYDGENVLEGVRPCGFILGDFGSAACLGKWFLADFLQDMMPGELAREFGEMFGLDYGEVVRMVYMGERPAAYLGTFAPFIVGKYGECEYVKSLVDKNFQMFIDRCVARFDTEHLGIGVVGSFGCACEEILRALGKERGLRFEVFERRPIEGLLRYHLG